MAKKKNASQAEKIVTDTKRKAPAGKSSKKKPPKKAANRKTPPKVQTEYENPVSTGIVAGLACMGLCVLLALVCFKPEGALLLAVKAGILGLVGRAGPVSYTHLAWPGPAWAARPWKLKPALWRAAASWSSPVTWAM